MGFYHVKYTMNTTKVDLQWRPEHSTEVLKLTRVFFALHAKKSSMLNRSHYELTELCRTLLRPHSALSKSMFFHQLQNVQGQAHNHKHTSTNKTFVSNKVM